MAAEVAPKSQRTKLIVVVVLAVVMLAAIGSNFIGADETFEETAIVGSPAVSTGVVVAPAQPTSPVSPSSTVADATVQAALALPEIELRRVIDRNPFRRFPTDRSAASELAIASNAATAVAGDRSTTEVAPATSASMSPSSSLVGEAPPNSGADSTQSVDAEPTLRVSAIVTGNGRPAALIGDKLYHENDILDDRWRIAAINASGIVVRPVEAKD